MKLSYSFCDMFSSSSVSLSLFKLKSRESIVFSQLYQVGWREMMLTYKKRWVYSAEFYGMTFKVDNSKNLIGGFLSYENRSLLIRNLSYEKRYIIKKSSYEQSFFDQFSGNLSGQFSKMRTIMTIQEKYETIPLTSIIPAWYCYVHKKDW